jgi:hypothetical protein
MGTSTWLVATSVASVACVAAAACNKDTGIVLEISMSSELETALSAAGEDFETLRIWVGHATDDPGYFAGASDAYYSTDRTRADFDEPFRYLLEPTSADLAAIGDMVFAAAVGDDPDDARLPFQLAGFAVADDPMDFHDGEVRIVPMTLLPPDGARGTIDDGCIVWDMDTQTPSRITPVDDVDCDGAVGSADCDDHDPSRNNLDADGDSFSSCEGDCMDDPDFRAPWLDPATVNPGAPDDESAELVCDHVDNDCDGRCQDEASDRDGSGSTTCGGAVAEQGLCEVLPADCDENMAGNQVGQAIGEACNGRDDACDGFLAPAIPCIIPDQPGKCYFGVVQCDELRGDFIGQGDALECKPLPSSFSQSPAPPIVCDVMPTEACLESPDPVGCPTGNGFARVDCSAQLSGDAACAPSRTALQFPGVTLPQECAWAIVGGTQQAEWEVGFVDANTSGALTPMPTNGTCTPHLVARARSRFPTARTVLVLLISPQNPSFGARPLFVHLSGEPNAGACSPDLTCTPSVGG